MSSRVFHKGSILREGFTTSVTSGGLLSWMNSLMPRTACTPIEGFPTAVTPKRFVSRVTSLTTSKAYALTEGFATFLAFIRFLSSVDPQVFSEGGTLTKGFATLTAFTGFLRCEFSDAGQELLLFERLSHIHYIYRVSLPCESSDVESDLTVYGNRFHIRCIRRAPPLCESSDAEWDDLCVKNFPHSLHFEGLFCMRSLRCFAGSGIWQEPMLRVTQSRGVCPTGSGLQGTVSQIHDSYKVLSQRWLSLEWHFSPGKGLCVRLHVWASQPFPQDFPSYSLFRMRLPFLRTWTPMTRLPASPHLPAVTEHGAFWVGLLTWKRIHKRKRPLCRTGAYVGSFDFCPLVNNRERRSQRPGRKIRRGHRRRLSSDRSWEIYKIPCSGWFPCRKTVGTKLLSSVTLEAQN